MQRLIETLGRPVRSAIRDWLVLNANELAWIALLAGLALFVGVFMTP